MERLTHPALNRSREEVHPRVAAGERDRRDGRDAAPADQPQQVAEAPAQQLERPPRGRADRGEQRAEEPASRGRRTGSMPLVRRRTASRTRARRGHAPFGTCPPAAALPPGSAGCRARTRRTSLSPPPGASRCAGSRAPAARTSALGCDGPGPRPTPMNLAELLSEGICSALARRLVRTSDFVRRERARRLGTPTTYQTSLAA